jgi:hypothetical protein
MKPSALRAIPTSRPVAQADREFLTPEAFARRAGGDESSRDHAVNQETFLRNEFGVRTFGYTSFVVEPTNGQIPPITPAAAARRKAMANAGTFGQGPFNTFTDFSLYDRCITRGVGGIFPVLYGNGVRIAQTPNDVIISYEMIHDTRVIPLDGRPHIASSITQYMGDARAHWGGDTLVVETTNFTDKTSFSGLHSDQLKLTERFTRIDPEMIDYRIRVEDPGYALSGERAYERMVEEAKAKGLPIPPRTMGMEVYSGAAVEGVQPVREVGGRKE